MLRAALDTGAWVAGVVDPAGACGRVLDLVRRRELEPVVSRELAAEVGEALRLPALGRYGVTHADVEELAALLAARLERPLPGAGAPASTGDPDDAPVVAAALAGHAAAIVAFDRDLLADVDLRDRLAVHGIEIVTPPELLHRLGR